jgi:hypothetical protein
MHHKGTKVTKADHLLFFVFAHRAPGVFVVTFQAV